MKTKLHPVHIDVSCGKCGTSAVMTSVSSLEPAFVAQEARALRESSGCKCRPREAA